MLYLRIFTILMVCVAGCLSAKESTLPARILPRASEVIIADIAVVNGDKIAVGERGHILLNGKQIANPSRQYLTALSASLKGALWAVGHDGIIIHQNKRSEAWKIQHFDPEAESPFFDVLALNEEEVIAVGAYGSFYLSNDAGESWEQIEVDEEEAHLFSIKNDDNENLYLAGEFGLVLKVNHLGEVLKRYDTLSKATFFGLEILSEDHFFIYGLRGRILYTADGETFKAIDTGTNNSILSSLNTPQGTLFFGENGLILLYKEGKLIDKSLNERVDITAGILEGDDLFLCTVNGFRKGVQWKD